MINDFERPPSEEALSAASERMFELGATSVSELEAIVLNEENPIQRRALACSALGLLRARSAAETLARILSDDIPELSWQAAFALGQIGSDSPVEQISECLRNSRSVISRRAAAAALGTIGDTRAESALLEVLRDTTAPSELRAEVAEALGNIETDAALEGLIAVLRDSDATVRFFAVNSLGLRGDSRAIPALRDLADDSAEIAGFGIVREEVRSALDQIERSAGLGHTNS